MVLITSCHSFTQLNNCLWFLVFTCWLLFCIVFIFVRPGMKCLCDDGYCMRYKICSLYQITSLLDLGSRPSIYVLRFTIMFKHDRGSTMVLAIVSRGYNMAIYVYWELWSFVCLQMDYYLTVFTHRVGRQFSLWNFNKNSIYFIKNGLC